MTKENLMAGAVMTVLFLCLPLIEAQASQPRNLEHSPEEEEEELREQLYRMGYYEEDLTGYFNMITSNAVTRFQQDYNLPATGIIGPLTKMKMHEIEMMARIVHGEARGEIFIGQVGVAAVVLNRIESSGFPDSTEEVIFQKNAFTAVNDDQYLLMPNDMAYQAVKHASDGADPTGGAVFYYNPDGVSDDWIYSRAVITQIGNHFFAE